MFASVLFVLISFVGVAQGSKSLPPPVDPSHVSGGGPPPPPGLPIDSGVYVLLVIGLVYGAYKMKKLRLKA